MSSYSENEDDPAVYESSEEEWDESAERKRNKRRSSQRLSKKPRITHVESSDSDDSDEKPVNGVNKKKKTPPKPVTTTKTTPNLQTKPATPPVPCKFTTGTFVISKKDASTASPSDPPCVWKIDGKALLQKFEPFEENGKIKHRNTSIYTGWSTLNQDNYAALQVQVFVQSGQKMIIEIDWDQLKTIEIDSE